MTSKTLWNKLFSRECRQKLWLYVILALVMFFAIPVLLLMAIDSNELNYYMTRTDLIEAVHGYLRNGYALGGFLTMLLGTLTAFFCFSFVYGKAQTDLYHSLPVRREKLFLIQYLAGLIPSILLQIVMALVSFGVLAAKGYLTGPIAKTLVFATAKSMVSYLIGYNVSIVAIMLTGNLIVGILGAGVLLFFAAMTRFLFETYRASCFQTFYSTYTEQDGFLVTLLTPTAVCNLTGDGPRDVGTLLLILLEALLIGVAALFLYKMRPSEAAGRTVWSKIAKPLIRIPLVIFAALCGGLFVSFLLMNLPAGWYFGVFLICGILTHAALDLIFEQDVKGMYRHPVQLVISLLAAAFIAVIFLYDLFGYDRYLPAEVKVETVSVKLENLESEMGHLVPGEDGTWEYGMYDDILQELRLEEKEPVLNLAREGIESLSPVRSAIERRRHENYDNSYQYEPEKLMYVVCYHLKNGKDVYRRYNAPIELTNRDAAAVYENPAYHDYIYQVDDWKETDLIKTVEARAWNDALAFDGTMIDTRTFLNAYAADLEERKFADLEAFPILRLTSYDNRTYIDALCGYFIYATDKHTLDYLKSIGVEAGDFECRIDPSEIREIMLYDYRTEPAAEIYVEDAAYSDKMVYGGGNQSYVFNREDHADGLSKIAGIMIPCNMTYTNSVLHPTCPWCGLDVWLDNQVNEYSQPFTVRFVDGALLEEIIASY
ncbi:MAG: hypothetical protein IKS87_05140 [Lachnospiraceae bacterium]|nr:hypothetical protein [Lachnospiraceae bacterium]